MRLCWLTNCQKPCKNKSKRFYLSKCDNVLLWPRTMCKTNSQALVKWSISIGASTKKWRANSRREWSNRCYMSKWNWITFRKRTKLPVTSTRMFYSKWARVSSKTSLTTLKISIKPYLASLNLWDKLIKQTERPNRLPRKQNNAIFQYFYHNQIYLFGHN